MIPSDINSASRLLSTLQSLVLIGALTVLTLPSHAEVLTTHRLPAALAGEAVLGAVSACAKLGYSVTATLLDMDGVPQASLRGDNATMLTVDMARMKAYTSVVTRNDTGVIVERYKDKPLPVALDKAPQFVMAQGGIIIKFGDEPIAAIAVAGAPMGDKDEACARAGLEKIADRLK